jgi:hypothetical protein
VELRSDEAFLLFKLVLVSLLMQTSSTSSLSRHKSVRVFTSHHPVFASPSIQSTVLTDAPSPPPAPVRQVTTFLSNSSKLYSPTSDSIRGPSHAANKCLLLVAPFKFGTENLLSSTIPEHHLAFAISRVSGDHLACG